MTILGDIQEFEAESKFVVCADHKHPTTYTSEVLMEFFIPFQLGPQEWIIHVCLCDLVLQIVLSNNGKSSKTGFMLTLSKGN